jgi:hypothetical protein
MDVTDSKATDGASPSGRQQYINRMSFTMPSPLLQSPKSGLIPSKSKLPLMFFSLVIGVGVALRQLWSGYSRSIDSGVRTSPNIYDKFKNLRATSSPLENRPTPTIFEMPARDQFVGAWVLKSYHIDDASTGARHYPLGQDAIGLIVSLLSFLCCDPLPRAAVDGRPFTQHSLKTYRIRRVLER